MAVAPTTLTRIEASRVSASLDLAQEILVVLGEPIGFAATVDRHAVARVDWALDPLAGSVAPRGRVA